MIDFQQLMQMLMPGSVGPGRFAQPNLTAPPETGGAGNDPIGAAQNSPLTKMLQGLFSSGPKEIDGQDMGGNASLRPVTGMPESPLPNIAVADGMPKPSGNQDALLRMMLSGGEHRPTSAAPAPAPRPMNAQFSPMSVRSEAVAAEPDGLMGQISGAMNSPTGKFLMEVLDGAMRGAGASHGTQMPNGASRAMAAFGSGYTGAADSMRKRQKEDEALKAAKSKLLFDQTLAIRKDSRAERAESRADKSEDRKAEESRLANQILREKLNPIRSDGSIPINIKQKIIDQADDYTKRLTTGGVPIEKADLDRAIDQKIKQLEEYYGIRKQGSTAASQGTREAPAQPRSKQDLDALPSGAFYLNPADGKVYQKK